MLALCAGNGGTNIDAKSAALTRALLQQLFKKMYDAGANFSNDGSLDRINAKANYY